MHNDFTLITVRHRPTHRAATCSWQNSVYALTDAAIGTGPHDMTHHPTDLHDMSDPTAFLRQVSRERGPTANPTGFVVVPVTGTTYHGFKQASGRNLGLRVVSAPDESPCQLAGVLMAGTTRKLLSAAVPLAAAKASAWAEADRRARAAEHARVGVPRLQPGPTTGTTREQRLAVPTWKQFGGSITSWTPDNLQTAARANDAFQQVASSWSAVQSLTNAVIGTIDSSTEQVNARVAELRGGPGGSYLERDAAVATTRRLTNEILASGAGSPMLADWDDGSAWSENLCDRPELVCRAGLYSRSDGSAGDPWLMELPSRSVTLAYSEAGNRSAAVRWAQGVALRVLASFPPQRYRLWVLDPNFGEAARSFSSLTRCNAGPLDPYWGSLLVDRSDSREIAAAVEALEAQATATGGAYLGVAFPTIWDFVASGNDTSEFKFDLVIAVDWDTYPSTTRDALQRLAMAGPDRGVTVIGLTSATGLEETTRVVMDSPTTGSWRPYGGRAWVKNIQFGSPCPEQLPAIIDRIAAKIGAFEPSGLPLSKVIPPESEWWLPVAAPGDGGARVGDSRVGLAIPLGMSGAKPFHMNLGDQPVHGIVTGVTGAGKTTAFHALINSLAACYSPDEMQLYLVDMKEGIEFQMYAPSDDNPGVPHVRVVATSADREFAVAVLDRLIGIIKQRSELFRKATPNVAGLAAYRRQETGMPLPRIVAIIDEFQTLFIPNDDELTSRAWDAIQMITKKGRAYGVHLLLGSQTMQGIQGKTASVREGVYQQMQMRLELTLRGAGLYKTNGPDDPGIRVQTAYSGDEEAMRVLHQKITNRLRQLPPVTALKPPFVFSGDRSPAAVDHPIGPASPGGLPLWLGQPCAVANPVAAYIRADRQRNVAVFGSGGSDDDDAAGLLSAAALSFAAQQPDGKLILINALPPVSRYQALPGMITAAAPDRTTLIEGSQGTTARDAAVAGIVALAEQVEQNITPTLIVGFGYHYLDITKKQDPETTAKMTALLTDGPHRHMWTVAWWDDLRTYKEVFGDNLELFGSRVMLTNAVHDARHLVNDPRRKDLRENRGVFWDRDDRNNPVTFVPYHPPETAVQLTRWANRVGITS